MITYEMPHCIGGDILILGCIRRFDMQKYCDGFATRDRVVELSSKRQPDFLNIEKILNKKCPDRSTLFEFFMNYPLFEEILQEEIPKTNIAPFIVKAFRAAGYDYATISSTVGFYFPTHEHVAKKSISQNDGTMIVDDKTFDEYPWPDADSFDYSYLKNDNLRLPDGMKAIACLPGGVLENAISLLGFENMCIMMLEKPEFVKKVMDKIGSILYRHLERCLEYDTVGACFTNDDWGFNTQTMIAPKDMREYVIPWHKKFADLIHSSRRYAILHSCGMIGEVMDDVINVMKSDGKHSYEDNIMSVEDSYEELVGKIAVLGGIDLDYVCRKSPHEVYERSVKMLERAKGRGGYGLGTGNSIPEYVPNQNVYAMLCAVLANS